MDHLHTKPGIPLLPLFGILLLLPASCAKAPAKAAERPRTPVETLRLEPRDLVVEYTEMATLVSPAPVEVSAEVPGLLVGLPLDEGDEAKSGEALAALDDSVPSAQVSVARARVKEAEAGVQGAEAGIEQARTQVLQAQARIRETEASRDLAKAVFDRKKELLDRRAVAPQVFDDARERLAMAEAALESAKAAVEAARAGETAARSALLSMQASLLSATATLKEAEVRLEKYTIDSPASGLVTHRFVEPGEMVAAGAPLLRIQTIDPLRAEVYVPERIASRVTRGMPAAIEVQEETLPGVVFRIQPAVDPSTRTVKVEVDVPNPDRMIRVGSFARVTFTIDRREGVLAVPVEAVQQEPSGSAHVFVVETGDEGAVAVRREVAVGLQAKGWVELLNGVEEEDAVVVRGLSTLSDGDPVTPQTSEGNTGNRPGEGR